MNSQEAAVKPIRPKGLMNSIAAVTSCFNVLWFGGRERERERETERERERGGGREMT